MRRVVVLGIAAIVTGVLVGVVVAGSDGGDGGEGRRSVPELTPLPGSSELGSGGDGERTNTRETTTEESGGTTAPAEPPADQGESGGAPPPEDSEQNDVPPPSGSPAERFEQFCQENPGAC